MKASEAGLNPYAPGGIGDESVRAGGDPALDPRAPGLDGDILDQLLKGRWQEGHETGYEDGHAAARQRYAPIFDDGFDQGQNNGLLAARAQIASGTGVLIGYTQKVLIDIAGKTGSDEVKALVQEGLENVQIIIERIAGVADQATDEATAGQEKSAP